MNSGLVLLNEGLCAQIYSFRFEISVVLIAVAHAFTSFAFLFQKKKYVEGKKQIVQDRIPPPSIYIQQSTNHSLSLR